MNKHILSYTTGNSEITLSEDLKNDLYNIWGIKSDTFCFSLMDAMEKLGRSGPMFLAIEVDKNGFRINIKNEL